MRVIAVYSIKGGVGKTAAAVNLADAAARGGYRVLLWDLDPQGAASFYLRVKPKVKGGFEKLLSRSSGLLSAIRGSDHERLDLMPADFSYRHMDLFLDAVGKPRRRLKELLGGVAQHYDLALLDCPPSISLASESVFRAAEALVSPVIPTPLSIRTLAQLEGQLAELGKKAPRLLSFLSMVDIRKRLHRELATDLPGQHRDFLKTWIPYSSEVEQMGVHRAPISAFAPRSRSRLAFDALWAELESQLETGSREPLE